MAIQGGPWTFFNEAKRRLGLKEIDLVGDAFKMALFSSALVPNIDTQADLADIAAHQVSGNGYPAGGVALGSKTWARDDANDRVVWGAATASFGPADGGPITARYGVIYDDTHASDALVCYCLLDETNADVSAPDGVALEVALPAGIGVLG